MLCMLKLSSSLKWKGRKRSVHTISKFASLLPQERTRWRRSSWGGTAPRISPRERGSVYSRSRTLPNDRGGWELSGCAPPCCSSGREGREGRHAENDVIDHLSLRPQEKPPVCRPLLAMRCSYFSTFARNLKKLCSQEDRNHHRP